MWDGKEDERDLEKRGGARLSQPYAFRWMRIHKSRHGRDRDRERYKAAALASGT